MVLAKNGIPYGKRFESDIGTDVMVDVLVFPAGQPRVFYNSPTGQEGSGANFYGWQSIFVDNSLNDYPVTLIFTGTLFTIKIPARSQGFVPVACPELSFSFTALCDNPAAITIPISLFSREIGPSIWATSTAAASAYTPSPYRNSATVNATGVLLISAATLSSMRFIVAKNSGTTLLTISIGTSTIGAGFRLRPNEEIRFDAPFPIADGIRAVSDAAGGEITMIGY